MKMNERNGQLKSALGAMAPKERIVESKSLPKEDTVNIQGHAAYSLPDELKLVTMLNTLKLEPQFYRSENKQMQDVRDVVEKVGLNDPYFLAQAIVWSRCAGEGMRSVNHLAAALAAPFASKQEWAKRFYGLFNKKAAKNGTVQGGCVFRTDDMSEIKDVWAALNMKAGGKMKSLPNAMKKGFASALESMDTYQLTKYPKTTIDIANLVHPNSANSKATVVVDGKEMKVLDALMQGVKISADTWEVAQSEAGQEVAAAVKSGKLTKAEAAKVLAEAKADNWEALLKDGRLGVLAALRNIRNIMKNPRQETIDLWCKLITDPKRVRESLILPCHFDLAYDVVVSEFPNVDFSPKVQQALLDGYTAAIPNLKDALPGRTLVIVDRSGSMDSGVMPENYKGTNYSDAYNVMSRNSNRQTGTCAYKAGLIAATICKATGADVVKFGSSAEYFSYNKNENVFSLARKIGTASCDSTCPAAAFELITRKRKAYDRIIFISDNEVNGRLTSTAYSRYIHDVCSPYVYGVDLAGYGTTPIKNPGKVQYLFGYGSQLFDTIASSEFNPNAVIDKIKAVVI